MIRQRVSSSFWVRSLVVFAGIVLLLLVVPWVVGLFRAGSIRFGFPIRFYWHDASPPPFFETRFEPWALAANLVIYLVVAIALSALVGYFGKGGRGPALPGPEARGLGGDLEP
jgi:hypothetical protein